MTDKNSIIESVNKLFDLSATNNYIFIYTPPKVGSTTLVSSLRISLGKSYTVIHIHDEVMLSVLTGIQNVKINDIIHYLSSIGKKVYVIDVYRTPIERKLSEFFEKISPYHFNNTEENINTYSISRVSDRFNKLFPHLENGDHYFDKYNIPDPIPFDFEKKYTIQEYNGIIYIKLRLCDSKLWDIILSTILKCEVVIITDYTTETKKIGDLYNKFKKEYKLPINFFEIIKQCKFLSFYYTELEKEKYLNFWKSKIGGYFEPYTETEYAFYMNLCLENQHINDVQPSHYVDNGCFCNLCIEKRREIFIKSKKGDMSFNKIVHTENVCNRNKKAIDTALKRAEKIIYANNKYIHNQFKIKLK